MSETMVIHHTTQVPLARSRYEALVENVRLGESEALEELYGLVKNFTFFLMRQLGTQDLQDKIHDIFLTVVQAVGGGKLRDPDRLIPFLTTVTRFYTYNQIERRTQGRKRYCPIEEVNVPDAELNLERTAYNNQKRRIVLEILRMLPRRDRDVLHRFYLEDQSKEQICRDLKLTATQFRLLKSKAKSKFTRAGTLWLQRCRAVA